MGATLQSNILRSFAFIDSDVENDSEEGRDRSCRSGHMMTRPRYRSILDILGVVLYCISSTYYEVQVNQESKGKTNVVKGINKARAKRIFEKASKLAIRRGAREAEHEMCRTIVRYSFKTRSWEILYSEISVCGGREVGMIQKDALIIRYGFAILFEKDTTSELVTYEPGMWEKELSADYAKS